MKPNTNTNLTNNQPMPWLVMYCNNGDISILDILEHKKAESKTTGILDFFVPLDVTRLVVEGKSIEHKRLIAGNYIFLRATREDILRLRQEPPFDATLRFLHPATSPTCCIYISDEEMLRCVGKCQGTRRWMHHRSSWQCLSCAYPKDFSQQSSTS